MAGRCIWCLQPCDDTHLEHIFPESLGCPAGLTLPGSVVCRRCNNGLGHLDQALLSDFEFVAFLAGIPRKGGRPPVVASRGNVRGSFVNGKPAITFNLDAKTITSHDGSHVAGFRGRSGDVRAKFARHGTFAHLNFSLPFGESKKSRRALLKVAMSLLAHFLDPERIYGPSFDVVRRFVAHGEGERRALVRFCGDGTFTSAAWRPWTDGHDGFLVPFRILVAEFYVDLSPDERLLAKLKEQFAASNATGWCVIPPE